MSPGRSSSSLGRATVVYQEGKGCARFAEADEVSALCCRDADIPAPHAPGPALFPVPARVPHRVRLDRHGEG